MRTELGPGAQQQRSREAFKRERLEQVKRNFEKEQILIIRMR